MADSSLSNFINTVHSQQIRQHEQLQDRMLQITQDISELSGLDTNTRRMFQSRVFSQFKEYAQFLRLSHSNIIEKCHESEQLHSSVSCQHELVFIKSIDVPKLYNNQGPQCDKCLKRYFMNGENAWHCQQCNYYDLCHACYSSKSKKPRRSKLKLTKSNNLGYDSEDNELLSIYTQEDTDYNPLEEDFVESEFEEATPPNSKCHIRPKKFAKQHKTRTLQQLPLLEPLSKKRLVNNRL